MITRAAPAFHKLFMVMGCVFDINTVHKTVDVCYASNLEGAAAIQLCTTSD